MSLYVTPSREYCHLYVTVGFWLLANVAVNSCPTLATPVTLIAFTLISSLPPLLPPLLSFFTSPVIIVFPALTFSSIPVTPTVPLPAVNLVLTVFTSTPSVLAATVFTIPLPSMVVPSPSATMSTTIPLDDTLIYTFFAFSVVVIRAILPNTSTSVFGASRLTVPIFVNEATIILEFSPSIVALPISEFIAFTVTSSAVTITTPM